MVLGVVLSRWSSMNRVVVNEKGAWLGCLSPFFWHAWTLFVTEEFRWLDWEASSFSCGKVLCVLIWHQGLLQFFNLKCTQEHLQAIFVSNGIICQLRSGISVDKFLDFIAGYLKFVVTEVAKRYIYRSVIRIERLVVPFVGEVHLNNLDWNLYASIIWFLRESCSCS